MLKQLTIKHAFSLILALAICAGIFVGCGKVENGNKYLKTTASYYIYNNVGANVIYLDAKKTREIPGEIREGYMSLDRRGLAALVSVGGEALYSLYTKEGVCIAKSVAEAVLSLDGEALAFWVGEDSRYGDLYVYSGGVPTLIYSGHTETGYLSISPDGKAVAYLTYADDSSETPVSYCYYDGENYKLNDGEYAIPMAVTNNASYIYYVTDNAVVAQKGLVGNETNRLYNTDERKGEVFFNSDLTEVLYSAEGSTFIVCDGNERIKLDNASCENFVVPYGTATMLLGATEGLVIGVDSFADTFYANDAMEICYIDKEFKSRVIANDIYRSDEALIADDNRTVFYVKKLGQNFIGHGFFRIDGKDSKAEEIQLASIVSVSNVTLVPDGKSFYYVEHGDELYYQKGTGEPKRIEKYSGMLPILDGNSWICVSNEDEDGYYLFDGSNYKKIAGIDKQANYINSSVNGVTIATSASAYYSTDGKIFKAITDEFVVDEPDVPVIPTPRN